MTHVLPWFAVQARLELAKAHLALSDAAARRRSAARPTTSCAAAPRSARSWPKRPSVARELSTVADQSSGWASTLTAAELRLLPLLTTHLSFREIAERLFVSRNTVKTQAISVYRKLDASSRSEAIERAIELGLVDAAAAARRSISPARDDAFGAPRGVQWSGQPVDDYKLTLRRLALRDDRYIDALLERGAGERDARRDRPAVARARSGSQR